MVVLMLQETRQSFALSSWSSDAESLPTVPGDLVVLQSLSFKLRVRVDQVNGLNYVGRIVECRRDGYVGEDIEFDERHIVSRQRQLEAA
jgi:hypothetical protein